MKAKLFLLLLAFGFVLGCSTDPLVDDSQTADVTFTSAKERPFKVRGQGTFEMVATTECDTPYQIALMGNGNGTHVGLFSVEITWCTDFDLITYLTGTITAANGDLLYFYSVGFGVDDNGEYGDYIFEGGTGRFDDCYGELRLHTTIVPTSPGFGTYTNFGDGYLIY